MEKPLVKTKKKQLPKDFEALLEKGDLEELKAIFDGYDVNARGGYGKQTALAFRQCPDELTRWLVGRGADLAAEDDYGETPLHARARYRDGRIEVLLELGADVHHGENARGTPLHSAAGAYNVTSAGLLLRSGARVDALNRERKTPLAYALERCRGIEIEMMARLAELLLGAGAQRTPQIKAFVTRIGGDFEFHRGGFNPESLDATSAALGRLYELFDVAPVPRRAMHDGKSPIVATGARWEDRHDELWSLLVPSSGAASTVQGEVVRIAGRIADEIEGNGGVNWDRAYRKMANAFLAHVSSGNPLADALLAEARSIVAELKHDGDTLRLCELAVLWVALNPWPMKLPPPDYNR